MSAQRNVLPLPALDDTLMYDLLWSRIPITVVTLAQELGLFEQIARAPLTVEAAAESFKTTPRAIEAVFSVLAALGVLVRDGAGAYTLAPVGATYLLPSSPFYYASFYIPPDDPVLQRLRIAFRSGTAPANPRAVGMANLPDDQVRRFIGRMHMMTVPAAGALAQQPVFRSLRRMLDVGGGSGSLTTAIAARYPEIRISLMDLAPVCRITAEYIAQLGLDSRVHTLVADMFRDEWPGDYDGVLFGNIFHNWEAETCLELARRAFCALRPGGAILLHEMPLHETRDGPLTVACQSIAMLIAEKGKQYTGDELGRLLTQAGFINVQMVQTFSYYHLISATKPESSI